MERLPKSSDPKMPVCRPAPVLSASGHCFRPPPIAPSPSLSGSSGIEGWGLMGSLPAIVSGGVDLFQEEEEEDDGKGNERFRHDLKGRKNCRLGKGLEGWNLLHVSWSGVSNPDPVISEKPWTNLNPALSLSTQVHEDVAWIPSMKEKD